MIRLMAMVLMGGALVAQTPDAPKADAPKAETAPKPARENGLYAVMNTTLGAITMRLFEKEAPITVRNFTGLVRGTKEFRDPKTGQMVKRPFFTGITFHRVIPGFMIQGGGFAPDMSQKKNRAPIRNEATNGLKNLRGTIAMARTNEVNSATSQFFINLSDNAFLDNAPGNFGYAVFGKVVDGLDTIDRIAKERTARRKGHDDVPATDVVIVSAKRVPANA
jgi:cyclophilin family peptidyl-prolyl cis-trans isomerase